MPEHYRIQQVIDRIENLLFDRASRKFMCPQTIAKLEEERNALFNRCQAAMKG